jgi:hypothetical protein
MSMTYFLRHPNQRDDEEFVDNADDEMFRRIIYPNKRRGTHVLRDGDHGEIVDQSKTPPKYRMFPVFAPKADILATRRALYGMDKVQLVPV